MFLEPTPRAERGAQAKDWHRIPGLRLIPEFVTEAEEAAIISAVDNSPWSRELQRRVQHYGWRYGYKSRQVEPTMQIGPLPRWAHDLAHRLVDAGYFRRGLPDQVIVNEYLPNQGISAHVDSPLSFDGVVATISLLETWEMVFQRHTDRTRVTVKLDRRSATILEGDARYRWTHEIRKRHSEPSTIETGRERPIRVPCVRRISLTFRKVKGPPGPSPDARGYR